MDPCGASKLFDLQKENRSVEKMFAEMSIENRALNSLIEKNSNTPREKRDFLIIYFQMNSSVCQSGID